MHTPVPLAEAVVHEIRAEMSRQARSGNALAIELGVSDMYISRRLRGETPCSITDVERIAAALGVPVERFLAPAPAPTSTAA